VERTAMKILKKGYDSKYLIAVGVFGAVAVISGCSMMLPSAKQYTESPWDSYEAVKDAFDKIVPGQTTMNELKSFGFDPMKTPNFEFLNYLDIVQKFLPTQSIRIEDLDPAIQTCYKVKDLCSGLRVSPEWISNKRYGNLFLDLFNFNRKTKTSGWRFDALLVVIDNVVIYKLYSGQPKVLRDENRRNPLGPLQDIRVNPPGIDLNGL
jgi:hypothetical protein